MSIEYFNELVLKAKNETTWKECTDEQNNQIFRSMHARNEINRQRNRAE